jgi:hypothetical protein
MSWSSFSQTVTNQTEIVRNDSVVKLEVPIVKLVIKDLVTLDGLKLQLVQTEELLRLSNDKIMLKDSVISTMDTKILNLQTIISKKDEQFNLERQKSESLIKELKQEKRKGFFYKMGSGIAVITTILFLVK